VIAGKYKCGRTTGAGVLDVHDRNVAYAHGAQGDLAANHVLAFHVALRGISEERTLKLGLLDPGVGQRGGDGLLCQVLDASVQVAAKGGHAHADYIDIFQRHSPWASLLMRERGVEFTKPLAYR
jgi:hypothetical protein